eukprot:TRINITY_DN9968_c0_g1_i6.p1 TRINITY_DN9968_c0_g1~~TRINITY_DN9968_c0_g1_i6.p1  ORF type:complete len:138 (-),score=23.93 TRINITY_DN9968_c0_g1_i6:48-419(-)
MTDVIDFNEWLNSTNTLPSTDNDLSFLLDDKSIDVLQFTMGDNIKTEDTVTYDSTSSEDEMQDVQHPSPSSVNGDFAQMLFPGSPSSSEFSDLSPLLNTWANDTTTFDNTTTITVLHNNDGRD